MPCGYECAVFPFHFLDSNQIRMKSCRFLSNHPFPLSFPISFIPGKILRSSNIPIHQFHLKHLLNIFSVRKFIHLNYKWDMTYIFNIRNSEMSTLLLLGSGERETLSSLHKNLLRFFFLFFFFFINFATPPFVRLFVRRVPVAP